MKKNNKKNRNIELFYVKKVQIFFICSKFGQQKKLDIAMRVYAESIKGGLWPTVYTLTSMVNACVRCGELERAQNYLREMETAGIKANEVSI